MLEQGNAPTCCGQTDVGSLCRLGQTAQLTRAHKKSQGVDVRKHGVGGTEAVVLSATKRVSYQAR